MHASVFVCPYLCYICLHGRHVCFALFGSISVSRNFFSFPISSGSILPGTICIVFHRPVRIWFIIKKMRVSFHLGNR